MASPRKEDISFIGVLRKIQLHLCKIVPKTSSRKEENIECGMELGAGGFLEEAISLIAVLSKIQQLHLCKIRGLRCLQEK